MSNKDLTMKLIDESQVLLKVSDLKDLIEEVKKSERLACHKAVDDVWGKVQEDWCLSDVQTNALAAIKERIREGDDSPS